MTDFILNTWAVLPSYVRSTFWILVVTVAVILSVAFTTLWERKVIGWMQLRKGPNRVGSIFGLVPGIFQPFADVIKLLLKEVVIPSASNKWLFRIAPAITLIPAFAAWAVVPLDPNLVIADIDAGFGNEEATYLMAKQMIEAGACCIQIENQVSDEKQCGHQDGKVTVPHSDFLAKINAVRYAFLELGVDDGVIVARTDSLGAGLTKQIAVTNEAGDIGDQYNSFLDVEEVTAETMNHGDVLINQNGKLVRPKRLPSNLYQFKKGTGEARCILDSITSLQNGADLIWIETEKPHIGQIGAMMDEIKKVVPNAKLVYNNSPSFNWTLNFRQQVFDSMIEDGADTSSYERDDLMDESYDATELAIEADKRIQTFQADAARDAGIFHHLITLPTYHTAALSTDNLAKEYFGDKGMLGYVEGVQRKEIRQGIACVKHQNMAGSDMGDDHKEYFAGEAALKASGDDNTMNQF